MASGCIFSTERQYKMPFAAVQQASGVSNAILDRLRQVGALGDLPESSQVSFF